MTRTTRRLIFYALLLVFLIAAPLTILYATGYSFDWSKKQLIRTGAFYFKSTPKGSSIYIDGAQKGITPAFVDQMSPGSHSVQITKDGYFSWQKNMEIPSDLSVTEARDIFLIPQNPKITIVSSNATSTADYLMTPEQKTTMAQASKSVSSVIKDVASWTVFDNNIYYLQKSNFILYQRDLLGNAPSQLSIQALAAPKNEYKIIASSEQIAALEPNGNLWLLDSATKTFKLLSENIRGAEFSPDTEKILYWNDHEIWTLWLKDVLTQPYKTANQKELLTRYEGAIKQAIWLPDTNEHIIFVVGDKNSVDKIKITELDSRDFRNTYNIFSGKNIEVSYDAKNDLLYLMSDKKLYSIDLIRT